MFLNLQANYLSTDLNNNLPQPKSFFHTPSEYHRRHHPNRDILLCTWLSINQLHLFQVFYQYRSYPPSQLIAVDRCGNNILAFCYKPPGSWETRLEILTQSNALPSIQERQASVSSNEYNSRMLLGSAPSFPQHVTLLPIA